MKDANAWLSIYNSKLLKENRNHRSFFVAIETLARLSSWLNRPDLKALQWRNTQKWIRVIQLVFTVD